MKNFGNLFKIREEDIDNKKSSLVLTTALSIVGLAALAVIEIFVTDHDEDEKDSEADPSEE